MVEDHKFKFLKTTSCNRKTLQTLRRPYQLGKVNLTKLVRIKTIMSTFVCGRCAMSCATMQTLGGHFKYYQAVQSKRRRGDAVLDA